jgi:hypothetical protein
MKAFGVSDRIKCDSFLTEFLDKMEVSADKCPEMSLSTPTRRRTELLDVAEVDLYGSIPMVLLAPPWVA